MNCPALAVKGYAALDVKRFTTGGMKSSETSGPEVTRWFS
jgi:hypothetical protein